MSVLYDRRFRVSWGVASAAGAIAFACLEVSLRTSGRWSPLAPSAALFTLGVVAGLAWGAFGAMWEHHLLRHKRDWLSKFHRLPVRERLRWPVQKENWAMNGWVFVVLLVLIAGCWHWDVFVLPPLLAANAVQALANLRLAEKFNAQLLTGAG